MKNVKNISFLMSISKDFEKDIHKYVKKYEFSSIQEFQ